MSKVSKSPSCPLVELPDVRKALIAPAIHDPLIPYRQSPQGGQSLRSFLQV